jgi:hypothetical protein
MTLLRVDHDGGAMENKFGGETKCVSVSGQGQAVAVLRLIFGCGIE